MAVNTKAFAGWWFYGAGDSTKRAALSCSWGLVEAGAEVVYNPRTTLKAAQRDITLKVASVVRTLKVR